MEKEYLITCEIVRRGFFSNETFSESDVISANSAQQAVEKWKEKWSKEITTLRFKSEIIWSIKEVKLINN